MVARADLPQLVVRVAQDVRDPVAVRVQRRAQPPRGLRRGQHDVEVRPPDLPVAHPLHVAAVRVERHRPADAVDQRLRVAVVVVGARDALLVVRRPTGSASCPSGTACPRAAAGTCARANASTVERPHVASSPMWCGSSAISSVGRSAQRRRCTSGPAATVAYVTATPCRSRGSGPGARSAGSAPDGCRSARRPAPTGGRCASSARPRRRAPRAPRTSIRWATCRPNVVLPAAGVAEARNASPEWSKTAAAAACCHARSGRAVGQDGRERPAAGRGGASISYVTGRGKLGGLPDGSGTEIRYERGNVIARAHPLRRAAASNALAFTGGTGTPRHASVQIADRHTVRRHRSRARMARCRSCGDAGAEWQLADRRAAYGTRSRPGSRALARSCDRHPHAAPDVQRPRVSADATSPCATTHLTPRTSRHLAARRALRASRREPPAGSFIAQPLL